MITHPNQVSVFLSYAHEDEEWLKKLRTHLSLLRRQNIISDWYDRLLVPGTDWSRTIDQQLERASLILLLISADFLASDYCYEVEMQRALKLHEAGQARVIPIAVRPADWKDAPFTHLQALPTDAKPLSTWDNEDTALVDVVEGLRRALEDLASSPATTVQRTIPHIWQIPFSPNPFFTGREDLLQTLTMRFRPAPSTPLSQLIQVLSGMGGVGKTQLAVEYAYRYATQYDAVFWIRAQTVKLARTDYLALVNVLDLKDPEEKNKRDEQRLINAVSQWLQTHSRWLLILDNLEDLEDLKQIDSWLPKVSEGHILLTTQLQITRRFAQLLSLEEFLGDDGAILLLRRARILDEQDTLAMAPEEMRAQAIQISTELGGLPLALDQAGAYIEETRCSLAEYLQDYQTHGKKLLKKRGDNAFDHPDPITTTVLLSHQKVYHASPAANDLLKLLAFLYPDAIPEEIITASASRLGPLLGPVAADSMKWNLAIKELLTYSLMKRNSEEHLFSIHRLVQTILKNELSQSTQRRWVIRAVEVVNGIFQEDDGKWRQRYPLYLPQVYACATLIEQWEMISSDAVQLLTSAALYLQETLHFSEAEAFIKQVLTILYQQPGGHPLTVASHLWRLAKLLVDQGKYRDAESIYEHAFAIYEHLLGVEHLDTVAIGVSVAFLYIDLAQYDKALPFLEHALDVRERVLGIGHPETASVLHGLANLYKNQCKFIQAEPLYQRALRIYEQMLEPEHLETATTLHDLANLYQEQGKFVEAEPLYQRALLIKEQTLGPEHPETATTLHNIALLYYDQGKLAEAEPLYLRVLRIGEQTLGPEHPETATMLHNIALLYYDQGKLAEAEPLYLRALRISEQRQGPNHPGVATTLKGLAELYREQGKYAEAEPLYQRALRIQEQSLGPDHPNVASPLNGLANLYADQGKYAEAEPLYQRALRIREQSLGPDHPLTRQVRDNYAILQQAMGSRDIP